MDTLISMQDTKLQGRDEIESFYGRSWKTIEQLISKGFPAVKVNGRWESDKILISNYHRKMIESESKKKTEEC